MAETGKAVLVVEDESAIALNLKHTLSSLGYLSATASSGPQALQVAETLHPQIVIMDLRLRGGVDGIDAAAQLRGRHGAFALIYSTGGSVDGDWKFRAMQTSPDAWLAKPYTLDQLKAALSLAESRLSRQSDVR